MIALLGPVSSVLAGGSCQLMKGRDSQHQDDAKSDVRLDAQTGPEAVRPDPGVGSLRSKPVGENATELIMTCPTDLEPSAREREREREMTLP